MATQDNSNTTRTRQRRAFILSEFYRTRPSLFRKDKSYDFYQPLVRGGEDSVFVTASGYRVRITPPWMGEPPVTGDLIQSKNNLTEGGFTIGALVEKDMDNQNYTEEFDPNVYQADFFPGMADFIDENIVAGDKDEEDRLNASYWNDLGNDVFDDWGYFYLYSSGKYYFPLIAPQNEEDGVITTQTFSAFDRIFTIAHGWTVQGIFKFDISVDDDLPFRFGAYGNMGSDGDQYTENKTHAYSIGDRNLTLHYHLDQEEGDDQEILYTYVIPKQVSENSSQTYDVYYNDDDYMSLVTKEVTRGVILYFAKTNDVKEWVANDLTFA
jgi:hypothetical protein